MVYRQAKFPVLQHNPAILIGFSLLREFSTKKGVAIQKDCGKPQKGTILWPYLINRFVNDLQVFRNFFFRCRPESQCFEKKTNGFADRILRKLFLPHQIIYWGDRADYLGIVYNRRR